MEGIKEMLCDWKVGDKVVCINDTFLPEDGIQFTDEKFPVLGEIYTIREISPGASPKKMKEVYLKFVELVNSNKKYVVENSSFTGELQFGHLSFRKVQPSKKSIDAIVEMMKRPDPEVIKEFNKQNEEIKIDTRTSDLTFPYTHINSNQDLKR